MQATVSCYLQVVDVWDEFHNPGLREVIKAFSQWLTILRHTAKSC
jgi:hypothetical protein